MSLTKCETVFCTGVSSFATHKLREIGKKLSAQRFQGTFLGGQELMIGLCVSKDDHLLITGYVGYDHDPEFVCPKVCVMSSPIAVSKV